jgi:hypothetical protein
VSLLFHCIQFYKVREYSGVSCIIVSSPCRGITGCGQLHSVINEPLIWLLFSLGYLSFQEGFISN